jgi:uncharacterized membrane protein YbhN (UPF0104 family)
MTPAEPERRRLPILRLVLVAGVIVLGVLLARRLDFARVWAALGRADWRLVALAALINVTFNTVARVRRWSSLLAALPRNGEGARFGELAVLYFASQATSNLLPARAGEALRVVQLHRRHGYAISGLITVQVVETLVGAMTLGLLSLVVAPLSQTPGSLSAALFTFSLGGLGGGLTLFALAQRAPSVVTPPTVPARGFARLVAQARGAVVRLLEAVRSLRSPRVWAGSLAWSLASDVTDVLMVGLVLTAVGVSLSPVGWVVAFVVINLALILPTTPAQLGVLEMGAVAALRMLGVDEHAALAFALLYHASHVIPPTLIGGLLLLRLDLRRGVAEDAAADSAP